MPHYEHATDETKDMAAGLLHRYAEEYVVRRLFEDENDPARCTKTIGQYQEIIDNRVAIEFLMVYADRDASGMKVGPALALHGVACLGTIKVNSTELRARGMGDVIIKLDGDWWVDANKEEKMALLDHEIFHIDFCRKDGVMETDSLGRPRIKMRPHTVDIGWFAQIAKRHGGASPEIQQAATLHEEYGQYFFPGMSGIVDQTYMAGDSFASTSARAARAENATIKATAARLTQ